MTSMLEQANKAIRFEFPQRLTKELAHKIQSAQLYNPQGYMPNILKYKNAEHIIVLYQGVTEKPVAWGCSSILVYDPLRIILSIFVDPDWRTQGLGKYLLTSLFDKYQDQSGIVMYWDTRIEKFVTLHSYYEE